MGNVMGALLSGFGDIVGKLLGHPLDFLSGKACSTTCAPTWDFLCYVENFCIPQLLKSTMVSILLYFALDCCCTCICFNIQKLLLTPRHNRRRRHQKDIEEALVDISSNSSESQGSIKFDDSKRRKSMRENRKENMRKSLRPKSHNMQVQIVNDSINHHKKKKFKNGPIVDHIRVSRRTKFAQKRMFVKVSTHSQRRA
ncbi:hypothetical protein RDI58_026561 [Solanum bulbocastanum]|uniref:Uncharacterized protein n=1 Tax=Solanum bulbocastanum TaxID=147425 RepID=A0AAN8SVK3_SOLBU